MIDNNPDHLYPDFRAQVLSAVMPNLAHWAATHLPGYVPQITEGFRTTARQQELYAQGRTKPGEVVTNCDGVKNRSRHQSALACDIAWMHNGNPTWDVPESAWLQLQHEAHAAGLTSGHDWHSMDEPHVQAPGLDPMTPAGKILMAKANVWKDTHGLV